MLNFAQDKITLTERKSLSLSYNLADAQSYVGWNSRQQEIIDRFPATFREASAARYDEIIKQFLSQFFVSMNQAHALNETVRKLLCYSATIGLEVAMNYMRQHREDERPVGILHPTFDTIPYIAERQGLGVQPIPEATLKDIANEKAAPSLSAIILTIPNNPTGVVLTESEFRNLVKYCKSKDVVLIIDCCYRYYSKTQFDYYSILLDSCIDFLLIEDTGKLFPLVDIKVGILTCNERIFRKVESIHLDFLLEVSKFSLSVITQFLAADTETAKTEYLKLIEKNRSLLLKVLGEFGFEGIGGENINIQLLQLPSGLDSTKFQKKLADQGVGVVDGKRLYWGELPAEGCRIRVALSRGEEYFRDALGRVTRVIRQSTDWD